jgi:hypothetical protein
MFIFFANSESTINSQGMVKSYENNPIIKLWDYGLWLLNPNHPSGWGPLDR